MLLDAAPALAQGPAAPTALSVGNGDTRLSLTWTAPAGTLIEYHVHYTSAPASGAGAVSNSAAGAPDNDASTAWKAVDRSGTTASQVITGLSNEGVTYRVRVRARSSGGNGAWVFGSGTPTKPVITFAVASDTESESEASTLITINAAPTLAAASSVNVRVDPASTVSSDEFTLQDANTATPLLADEGSPVTSIRVDLDGNDSVNEPHKTIVLNLEAITNAPYTLGTPKTFTLTITDNDPPAAPTGLSLIGEASSLEASWSKPAGPVTQYQLRYKEASATDQTATTPGDPSTGWVTSTPSGTSASITGLTDGTSYNVQVQANDGQTQTGNGWGAWSASATGTAGVHPNSPGKMRNLRAFPGAPGTLIIRAENPAYSRGGTLLGTGWSTGSEIHYTSAATSAVADGEPASGTDPTTAWVASDSPRSLITGLTNGTEYRVRARKNNAFGPGKWAHTTGTPQAQLDKTAPTVTVPDPYAPLVTLVWGDPTTLTPRGYQVHYTSAPETGTGAVTNDAAAVSGTDTAAGWVDVESLGHVHAVASVGGYNNYYFLPSAVTGGTEYRFRVRAVYAQYTTGGLRTSDGYSSWGHKTFAVGKHTAVGLYGYVGYENRGYAAVRVNLVRPVSIPVTVDYATADGTARSDGLAELGTLDYRAVSGTLTFAPGETEKWINVPIVNDLVSDSGETFTIALSNPTPSEFVAVCACQGYGKASRMAVRATLTIYNHEADLTALAVEGASDARGPFASLDIGAFTPETTEYAVTVPYDTTHARLTPTALRDEQKLRAGIRSNLQAVANGNASGAVPLAVGENTLVVESFLAGEEQKTYTVTITRQDPVAPGPVVDLTLTAEGDRVVVSWAAPTIGSAPKGYIVQLKPEGGKTGSGKTKRPKAKKTTVTYNKLEAGTTYNVWVRAQNDAGKGGRVHSTITLTSATTTATAKANSAPTVASEIADLSGLLPEDARQVSLAGIFTDTDRDALTISASSSNDGVATGTVNGQSLTVTGKQAGTTTITVTAADGRGGSVSDAFSVTVSPTPNNAPTVASALGDLSGLREGDARQVSLAGLFTDADGDALTITANSSNDGVATATVNGQSLTVSATQAGTTTITVVAADGRGGSVSDAFTVTVATAPKPNSAPTAASALGALSGLRVGDTRQVSLAGVFTDADGDALTITASSLNDNVATATVNGQRLTVSAKQAGTATIVVTAADGSGGSVTDSFSVTVEADAAPQSNLDPEDTQEPEPKSEQEQKQETGDASASDLPAIVQHYDQDGSGKIEQGEWELAIADYSAGNLTTQLIQVIAGYRG